MIESRSAFHYTAPCWNYSRTAKTNILARLIRNNSTSKAYHANGGLFIFLSTIVLLISVAHLNTNASGFRLTFHKSISFLSFLLQPWVISTITPVSKNKTTPPNFKSRSIKYPFFKQINCVRLLRIARKAAVIFYSNQSCNSNYGGLVLLSTVVEVSSLFLLDERLYSNEKMSPLLFLHCGFAVLLHVFVVKR